MYSSIPTPPQTFNPVLYSPSYSPSDSEPPQSDGFSIPLFPPDFARIGHHNNNSEDAFLFKKQFPSPLPTPPPVTLLSQESDNMTGHNIHYQRIIPGAPDRVNGFSEFTDPWYACMYPDQTYEESPTASSRASVSSTTVYSSPPTLSLATNILGFGPTYGYSAHPDSGIQVTPHSALSTKFSLGGGLNIPPPRSSTPSSASPSIPLLGSAYPSSMSDVSGPWESHHNMRHHQQPLIQQHQLERAGTFDIDTTSWRIPAYPDVNIVQPTPVNATATHEWPEPEPVSLKHRGTGLADAAISGRDSR